MELEGCLYSLLPPPWNASSQVINEESLDVTMKRLENIEKISRNDHKKYFDWRQNFMASIGIAPCPIIYKVQALFNSLQEDLRCFLAHTYLHGFNFLSYILIIKDLERIYGNEDKIVVNILEDLKKNNCQMSDINSFIAFSTNIFKIYTIRQQSCRVGKEGDMEIKIMMYLYQILGTVHTNEFKSYCVQTRAEQSTVNSLYKWLNMKIQEKSIASIESKLLLNK
uniref:Uncharacterized protein n=1 Tax=Lepeophtheirus salmonis TaxID=72036 RepID=A0A0K2V871_LEPSM